MICEAHVLGGLLQLLQDELLPLAFLLPALGLGPPLRLPAGGCSCLGLCFRFSLGLGQSLGLAPRPTCTLDNRGVLLLFSRGPLPAARLLRFLHRLTGTLSVTKALLLLFRLLKLKHQKRQEPK